MYVCMYLYLHVGEQELEVVGVKSCISGKLIFLPVKGEWQATVLDVKRAHSLFLNHLGT